MKGFKYYMKRFFGWLFFCLGCLGIYGWFMNPPQTSDLSFLFWAIIGTSIWFILAYFLLKD